MPLRNLVFPSQRLQKQTFWRSLFHSLFLMLIHLLWENEPCMSVYGTDLRTDVCSVWFPSPSLSHDQQKALRGCAERLAKTLKKNHFLGALSLPELLLLFLYSFFFPLSLGRSPTNAFHFVFYPDVLRRSRQQRKTLLTCLWVFLKAKTCLSYSKSDY